MFRLIRQPKKTHNTNTIGGGGAILYDLLTYVLETMSHIDMHKCVKGIHGTIILTICPLTPR